MQTTVVSDIRDYFINELANENFTIDKTGQKTIELIGASFIADEESIFGTPNKEYIKQEIDWYVSQSTNVNDISEKVPQAWVMTANDHGEINSNYGYLIFSDKYCRQYEMVLDELIMNPDGRRASMIYNRPSIWLEYDEGGKSDFICTNSVTYYIRDDALHCVVQMRSNDVIYGYKNDYAWQRYVLENLVGDYNLIESSAGSGKELNVGTITWQVQNLHVYERHFNLVE